MTSKNQKKTLETLLFRVYVSNMDPTQHIEMLERAVVIMSMALAFDEEASTMDILLKQEELISSAKRQAIEDMQIKP